MWFAEWRAHELKGVCMPGLRVFVFAALVAVGLFCGNRASFGSSAFSFVGLAQKFDGVSLYDLKDPAQPSEPEFQLLASSVYRYVRAQSDFALNQRISISLNSIQSLSDRDLLVTVDVFGADKRFRRVDWKTKTGHGFLRAEVQARVERPGRFDVTGHRLVLSRDLNDIDLKIKVSLYDRVALVYDDVTGFRRVFPLGVGSIDRVRYRNVTTLMTPTTELSVLNKNHLYRDRSEPKYYKKKPFIPLRVSLEAANAADKPVGYRTSAIAFHIWQEDGFYRGFLSHGCMRMRGADLDELLVFVLGTKQNIPVRIQMTSLSEAKHPFPFLTERYNEVFNAGTPENPKAVKKKDEHGVKLTKTVTVRKFVKSNGKREANPDYKIPSEKELTGISLDPEPGMLGPAPVMEEQAHPQP